jgi:dihydropteroate synthase
MPIQLPNGSISLDRVVVMGVLNVTPDSFSDGGRFFDPAGAVDHGLEMIEQGAGIVDVGGESTRPGATPVPESEELRRVLPVIESLAQQTDVPISIDTRKASVAQQAVEAGAVIVNDTLGEESDERMWKVAAETSAALVFMHSRGTPDTMRSLAVYDDVVDDVRTFLGEASRRIQDAGVAPEALVLDPGIGFAKNPRQNLQLLGRLDEIVALGHPVLAGTSRKSFIGAVLDLPEDQRVEGTAATVAWSVFKGARLVRVHDVMEMTRVVRMAEAIMDPDLAR